MVGYRNRQARSRAVYMASGGFLPVIGAALGASIESNVVTLRDIGSAVALTISGGAYSKNGGAYSTAATTISDGDTLKVRVSAPNTNSASASATISINGNPRTFSVTTVALATPTPTPGPTPTPTDTTAPTLSSATGTQTGQTTATIGATTDEANGTLYFFVSTSNTPPSAANLKTGTGAVTSGALSITSAGAKSQNLTGLTAATQYYTHWLHRDAAGNDSSILTGPGFTTAAATGGDTAPQALSTANDGFALGMFVVPGYANVGQPYTLLPAVKGGSGTKAFALSGTLPTGCAFNTATGETTGTPTTQGDFGNLQITCTDTSGSVQSEVFTIKVGAAAMVISPSGDTTGATDRAAINTALAAGNSVKMADGAWYQDQPIVTYSNQALYLPATGSLFLANGANCQMLRNANIDSRTRTDKNVSVVGPASAAAFLFNGNGGGQVRQSNQRLNQEIVFISAENYALSGFRVRGNASAIHFLGCYRMKIRNVYADQTSYTNNANQDGFDLGNGSSFIQVEGWVGGQSLDDVYSFYAKKAQSASAMMGGTPWSEGADVTDIIVNTTSTGASLNNMFRLQAGDTFKLLRLFVKDADNTLGGADKRLIQFGESSFLAAGGRGLPSDMAHIYVTGSAKLYNRLIAADSNFANVALKNLVINKLLTTVISTPDTPSVQYNNITVDGLTEVSGPFAHANGFSATRAGSTISNITLKNWNLGSMTALYNSTVTSGIQGVVMDNITFASGTPTVNSNPVSTGTMHNVIAAGVPVSPGASGLATV